MTPSKVSTTNSPGTARGHNAHNGPESYNPLRWPDTDTRRPSLDQSGRQGFALPAPGHAKRGTPLVRESVPPPSEPGGSSHQMNTSNLLSPRQTASRWEVAGSPRAWSQTHATDKRLGGFRMHDRTRSCVGAASSSAVQPSSAGLPEHEGDRWAASRYRPADDSEALPLVERDVSRVGGLQVRR